MDSAVNPPFCASAICFAVFSSGAQTCSVKQYVKS
jgi:hypothetical protein